MELTERHIKAIKEAARTVEYGSVTINISASSDKLELNVQNRIRIENEPSDEKKENGVVCLRKKT
jgi:hypothetical protein